MKWATLAAAGSGSGADVDTIKKTEKGGKKPQRNAHAQHAMSKERPKVVAKPQRKAKPRLL